MSNALLKRPTVISTEALVSPVEDRNGGEVEKSIKKQISRLAYGSLEMTPTSRGTVFNRASE